MRVIAGTFRSRILKSLKGQALRPTSDYLRETLFNVLGPSVSGARFLDLYAGTGAVGIEALSRGAVGAVFVENHGPAAKLIRENLASLKMPYAAEKEYAMAMNLLGASPVVSPTSVVIAEHRKSFELAETFGNLQRYRVLKQGDAVLSFFRAKIEEK